MSKGFGARLRAQRERQQVPLAAVAQQTKIKRSLLEGLERDDVTYWPHGIFRRAYIRAYARAITGLPLGSTEPRGHSGLVNLLGEIPRLHRVLSVGDAHVHVYGKAPREGRKVGHVTFNDAARALVLERMKHFEHEMKTHTPEIERIR